MVVLDILLIGIANEESYSQFREILSQNGDNQMGNFAKAGVLLFSAVTTGGFAGQVSDSAITIGAVLFLVTWLTTIFIVRHKMAGHKIKLRDGLYNAMTPLVSTFAVALVVVLECIPILFLIILDSVTVKTGFLSMPFYALLFFGFALLMLLISGYLLASSLMALVAVSAPGLYPVDALRTASDLMAGRRMKFIIRLIALLLTVIIIWVVVMVPLIMFDLALKNYEWAANIPFMTICFTVIVFFTEIYAAIYLYLYYRWILDYDRIES